MIPSPPSIQFVAGLGSALSPPRDRITVPGEILLAASTCSRDPHQHRVGDRVHRPGRDAEIVRTTRLLTVGGGARATGRVVQLFASMLSNSLRLVLDEPTDAPCSSPSPRPSSVVMSPSVCRWRCRIMSPRNASPGALHPTSSWVAASCSSSPSAFLLVRGLERMSPPSASVMSADLLDRPPAAAGVTPQAIAATMGALIPLLDPTNPSFALSKPLLVHHRHERWRPAAPNTSATELTDVGGGWDARSAARLRRTWRDETVVTDFGSRRTGDVRPAASRCQPRARPCPVCRGPQPARTPLGPPRVGTPSRLPGEARLRPPTRPAPPVGHGRVRQ